MFLCYWTYKVSENTLVHIKLYKLTTTHPSDEVCTVEAAAVQPRHRFGNNWRWSCCLSLFSVADCSMKLCGATPASDSVKRGSLSWDARGQRHAE